MSGGSVETNAFWVRKGRSADELGRGKVSFVSRSTRSNAQARYCRNEPFLLVQRKSPGLGKMDTSSPLGVRAVPMRPANRLGVREPT